MEMPVTRVCSALAKIATATTAKAPTSLATASSQSKRRVFPLSATEKSLSASAAFLQVNVLLRGLGKTVEGSLHAGILAGRHGIAAWVEKHAERAGAVGLE